LFFYSALPVTMSSVLPFSIRSSPRTRPLFLNDQSRTVFTPNKALGLTYRTKYNAACFHHIWPHITTSDNKWPHLVTSIQIWPSFFFVFFWNFFINKIIILLFLQIWHWVFKKKFCVLFFREKRCLLFNIKKVKWFLNQNLKDLEVQNLILNKKFDSKTI